MTHATSGELLELHFGELPAPRRDALAAHVRGCAGCRSVLDDLTWTEEALLAVPDGEPPADGLERVLVRIGAVRPVRERPRPWLRAFAPSAAAALAGVLAAHHGGIVAALAFFAGGSILTLAIAPVLILESQRRS
jgi:hypothetical protein